eukprot:TRINITY_DN196_c0_g3_i1.p1 TRINITY_DN196_c0_g3~~TRINITY_DN196_c0_g3_i1.p1  ORF type:complete len:433 (+),score=95.72 TRINITY_DN196_c0_g3_i1:21-1319(+)
MSKKPTKDTKTTKRPTVAVSSSSSSSCGDGKRCASCVPCRSSGVCRIAVLVVLLAAAAAALCNAQHNKNALCSAQLPAVASNVRAALCKSAPMTWKNIITQQLDAIQPLFVAGAFVVASLFYFLFSKDSLSKSKVCYIISCAFAVLAFGLLLLTIAKATRSIPQAEAFACRPEMELVFNGFFSKKMCTNPLNAYYSGLTLPKEFYHWVNSMKVLYFQPLLTLANTYVLPHLWVVLVVSGVLLSLRKVQFPLLKYFVPLFAFGVASFISYQWAMPLFVKGVLLNKENLISLAIRFFLHFFGLWFGAYLSIIAGIGLSLWPLMISCVTAAIQINSLVSTLPQLAVIASHPFAPVVPFLLFCALACWAIFWLNNELSIFASVLIWQGLALKYPIQIEWLFIVYAANTVYHSIWEAKEECDYQKRVAAHQKKLKKE